MELAFESKAWQTDPSAPGTHVLLAGCGAYPGLVAAHSNLKPLTPARRSVVRLADWFLSGADALPPDKALPADQAFHNPQAPLATVALLASPQDSYTLPSGATVACTRPTLANLNEAFGHWLERLGDQPGNRGIFYFCGHGLSNGEAQYLVADDALEKKLEPWKPLFHVSNTCQVAIRLTSATLSFWIDACMEFNDEVLNRLGNPQPLLDGPRSGRPMTRDWSLLRATTMNRLAFAPQTGVARFTEALLWALQGHCGTQYDMDAHFSVGADDLHDAMADYLSWSQQALPAEARQVMGANQGEGPGTTALQVLPQAPLVQVWLDVDPAGYRPVAQAFMERATQPREVVALANGPAQFLKAQGEWLFGAQALQDQFPEQTQHRLLKRAILNWKFRV